MEATTTPLVREGEVWERETEGEGAIVTRRGERERERDGERSSRKVDALFVNEKKRREDICLIHYLGC